MKSQLFVVVVVFFQARLLCGGGGTTQTVTVILIQIRFSLSSVYPSLSVAPPLHHRSLILIVVDSVLLSK